MRAIISYKIVPILIVWVALFSCKKEESDPAYIGKWLFIASTPQAQVDYTGSFIEIFQDKSFQIWDSSRQIMVDGGESRVSPSGLSVLDSDSGMLFTFRMVGLRRDIMTLKGSIEQQEYTITLSRAP
ncbi:MAG: hypothetical protein WC960_07565 [Bacteroidales bacterium]